jgi:transcriptional regulator GlxA family with amidase domain
MPGKETKLLAFPVYPGVTALDLVGPLTVLRNMIRTPYRTVVVGERAGELATDTPLGLIPAATFAEVPEPFAVLVPGGSPATPTAMHEPALTEYVRTAAASAELVGATGNGAMVLGAAGLLEGRRSASHWAYREQLEAVGATWAPERWVEDGRYLTAAGGTAGIDMTLALRARLTSRSNARMMQLFIEYDPEPPFGPVTPADGDGQLAAMLATTPRPKTAGTGADDERVIAFVLYPGLTLLDLVGPLQVLAGLEKLAPGFRTVVVWAHREPVPTDVGMSVLPDRTFDEVPHPAIVVVPGGSVPTIRAMSNPLVRDYVRSAAASADLVTSVCTGSLILGAVGLLEGQQATTNWFYSGILENLGAKYQRRRWVDNGNIIMSAGVSAGIDMALHLAARLTDEATARRVQRAVDYDPQPPFGGIDYDRIQPLPRAMRGTIGLAAPLLAARPKRLARAGR